MLSDDEDEIRGEKVSQKFNEIYKEFKIDHLAINEVVGQGKREDDADQWRRELRAKPRPRTIRDRADIELR